MRLIIALTAATLLVHAQERKESAGPVAYRVEFDIRGGQLTARHFSMLVDDSRKGVFQVTGLTTPIDVGAKIECLVHESQGKADLSATIEISEVTGQVNFGPHVEPIVGQSKAEFHTTVELGKRTVVVDEQKVDRQRIEATVTKVE
jgi:hypothetical protein